MIDLEDGRKGECQGVREKCSLKEGCPLFGTLLKPNRDGHRRIRGCGDKVAQGTRSKRRGGRGQRQAAKWLGVPNTSTIKTGHEEHAPGTLRFENKDGGQCKPVFTWYDKVRAQSDQAKSFGDHRPFVGTATQGKRTLFVIDAADALNFSVAYLGQNQPFKWVDL